jgi:hypothetical protein
MATLVENAAYLSIDGVDIGLYFKSITPNRSVDEIDVTRGVGTDHKEVVGGLLDTELTVTMTYDTTGFAAYIQHIKAGIVVPVEWGPEGAVSGKPRHVQNMLIVGSPISPQEVAKPEVTIELTLKGSGAPSVDLWSGGVYS